MRRALISLLLAVFSFPLIGPVIFAGSDLPACCRRDGKHHCAMSMDDSTAPGDAAWQSTPERCSSFPKAAAIIGGANFAILQSSVKVFAEIVSHPSVQPQTEARYRVSFNRSRQKRGPPAVS